MTHQWHEVYLVHDELRLSSASEVEAAVKALEVELPLGYREFVTTLGHGDLSGVLRVFPPHELEKQVRLFRELNSEYWFFDEPGESMTQAYALQMVPVADSVDGDQIAFHAGSGTLHVLPRLDQRTYEIGRDLGQAVDWMLGSGVLFQPLRFRYFDPFVGPSEAANATGRGTSIAGIVEAVGSLGTHDAVDLADDVCTFFYKEFGGLLRLVVLGSGELYGHASYRLDRGPDLRASVLATVASAGLTWGPTWATNP